MYIIVHKSLVTYSKSKEKSINFNIWRGLGGVTPLTFGYEPCFQGATVSSQGLTTSPRVSWGG